MIGRKFLRRKAGISTILANLLMVSIVFSLASVLFIWATASFGTYQGGTGLWFSSRSDAMKERFVIEEVYFTYQDGTTTKNNITIYVRNVGAIDMQIAAVYVNGTIGTTLSTPIGVGQAVKLSITRNWGTGSVTNIVVASGRGNIVKTYSVGG